LLLRGDNGATTEAQRLATDYEVEVSGPTARVRLTQMFHNPSATHVEAVYLFPMPESAAVDSLKMVVGERVVLGTIKEREAARRDFEQAKSEGRKAALLEQERPNMFTSSVANIGPGETVVVQIAYQETIRRTALGHTLRLPLVAAPRYNPKPLVETVDLGADGWGRTVADPVPDRARIEPPYVDPRVTAPANPVSIRVVLNAGFPLADVASATHALTVDETDESRRVVTLGAGAVPADRDFELVWRPVASRAPTVGLFRETVAGSEYALAFITPPTAGEMVQPPLPRELILVVDNSGSMSGPSMAQAKASLQFALQRLRPADRFNIVRFNHTMTQYFNASQPATPDAVAAAIRFVASLQATGGTEMLPALDAGLTDVGSPSENSHVRQVILLTDGAIGDEHRMFDIIASKRGRSRIFTVGIGSAPNSHLMARAAELGRGTYTYIGAVSDVETRMRTLFETIEAPVVTDLAVTVTGTEADVTPALLPDLHRGEPLVIALKLASSGGTMELKGLLGDQPWIVRLPLSGGAEGKGISKLWARRKIADAEVGRILRTLEPAAADKTILALALEHHLVSRLTSLVAVDQEISRQPGQPLARADIPLNLPAGWDFDKVFGPRLVAPPREIRAEERKHLQETRLTGEVHPTSAATTIQPKPKHAARPIVVAQNAAATVNLPPTATDAELRFLFGLALLLSALAAYGFARREA
jgi:Ca-activated chloride channel family protein